jgi:hypothetical protein
MIRRSQGEGYKEMQQFVNCNKEQNLERYGTCCNYVSIIGDETKRSILVPFEVITAVTMEIHCLLGGDALYFVGHIVTDVSEEPGTSMFGLEEGRCDLTS